jgi:catechol 2,3-dioxygenase
MAGASEEVIMLAWPHSIDETPIAIHPKTRLGAVSLTVANLHRQLSFYQDLLGLRVHWQEKDSAGLGAGGEDLLHLVELEGSGAARGTTGLYHFAVLLPSRAELARSLARLYAHRYPHYPTDHTMTMTTYLSDPEGNGIELYADTPERGTWGIVDGTFAARAADGTLRSGTDPLDVEGLLRDLAADVRLDTPLLPETKVGHVHLHVADLGEALSFYHGLLGFETMMFLEASGAGFVSAGGYHHHIGFNVWAGQGAPPPPAGSTGLRYFTIVLPDAAELERVLRRVREAGVVAENAGDGFLVRDPSRNGVLLKA